VGQYFDEPSWQGRLTEVHESTCSHCAHITTFPSLRGMMDYVDVCRGCMELICLQCVGKPCVTQEAMCDQIEKAVQRRREVEKWY
jgi:hypothetical protein